MESADVRVWMFLTLGDERTYRGNAGYEDDPRSVYRYDSSVQNWKNVHEGDFAVLRTASTLVGAARIALITERQGLKDLQRCPSCGTTAIKLRLNRRPAFRCNQKHEFEDAVVTREERVHFEAHFGDSFVPIGEPYDHSACRAAYINYSGQMSMQRLHLEASPSMIQDALRQLTNVTVEVMRDDSDTDYEPSHTDSRTVVARQIRERRGQNLFRKNLRSRYADACAISGCGIVDLLEAAHISPYRGADDNHPDNGILLRADLHTLFDLDLLGIHPNTLVVHVHPALRRTEYEALDGVRLRVVSEQPSPKALKLRWLAFQERSAASG